MSIRLTRVLGEIVSFLFIFCLVVGLLLIWGAASTSDMYAEMYMQVPDATDIKLYLLSAVMFLIMGFCFFVIKNIDFSVVYEYDNIPVYATKRIKLARKNAQFKRQTDNCLKSFQRGEFGYLSAGDLKANTRAIASGKGRILGEYRTVSGYVVIETNKQRTKTTIYFAEEYNER